MCLNWVGLTLTSFALAAVFYFIRDSGITALPLFLAGVFFLVFYPTWYWHSIKTYLSTSLVEADLRGIVGRIELKLTDESLTEVTETGRTEVRWDRMIGFEVLTDRAYIYVNEESAAMLPRAGFDTEKDYEAVLDFVISRLQPVAP